MQKTIEINQLHDLLEDPSHECLLAIDVRSCRLQSRYSKNGPEI